MNRRGFFSRLGAGVGMLAASRLPQPPLLPPAASLAPTGALLGHAEALAPITAIRGVGVSFTHRQGPKRRGAGRISRRRLRAEDRR
jgi:hypothetical protein